MQHAQGWSPFVVLVAHFLAIAAQDGGSDSYYGSESVQLDMPSPSVRENFGNLSDYNSSVCYYNSGARYYLRRTTTTLRTEPFGYTMFQRKSFYQSDFGFRVHQPPASYSVVYIGNSYVYFPPMFHYYHMSNKCYWNGKRPRHVCRNDNAFWPLENQTGLFVNGRLPAVNFAAFDEPPGASDSDENLSVLNSYLVNQRLKSGELVENAFELAQASPTSGFARFDGRAKVLMYNYFACPDGHNPNEIYCCGPPKAQYCCTADVLISETTSGITGGVCWTYTSSASIKLEGSPLKVSPRDETWCPDGKAPDQTCCRASTRPSSSATSYRGWMSLLLVAMVTAVTLSWLPPSVDARNVA